MRKLLVTFISLFALAAQANDFGVGVGYHTNSADSGTPGETMDGTGGLHAGGIGYFDVSGNFGIRTGALYSQRNFTAKGTATGLPYEVDIKLAYFDIPLTAMYKFADYGAIFGGIVFPLNVSKECTAKVNGVTQSSCTLSNVKSPIGYQFGYMFKFMPQMGAEVYYELFSGELTNNGAKDAKSLGVTLLFTFE